MALRGMMARLGVGGASVDTVLDSPVTTPGGTVTGQVRLTGGKVEQEVREVRLSLEARVEVESGDSEWREDVRFGTQPLAAGFVLAPGERRDLPFSFSVPWQCPVTRIGTWELRGMKVGVHTKVDIAGAVDPGDLDPVSVAPLPVQQAVLDALGGLGFRFRSADVEKGRLAGSELPSYQEVELAPPASLARGMNELEVTFLAGPQGVEVVLEADRRGGLLTEGRDVGARLRLSHADTDPARLAGLLDGEVRRLGQRRGWL
jgi:sporulation-control protein